MMAAFRRRVKIYATDVDEEALSAARRAVYASREVAAIPEPLREKYLAPGYAVRVAARAAALGDLRATRPRARRPHLEPAP